MKLPIVAILASALSLVPAFAPCRASDDPPPPIPDALRPAVAAAESTGRQLQRLDRAAWVATDTIRTARDARRLRRSVRGWITEDIDVGTRVSFFDGSAPSRLLYVVDVESSGRSTSSLPPGPTFADEGQQAMIRARQSALSETFLRCSRTYNTVVFPADDGIHVYLMPGTTQQGLHPAGGHHKLVYDASGTDLQSSRGFTRGCIDLQSDPGSPPTGYRPAGMMVTHLLDPQPTEIHVFISLNAPIPLMVMTSSQSDPDKPMIWKLKQGHVAVMRMPESDD